MGGFARAKATSAGVSGASRPQSGMRKLATVLVSRRVVGTLAKLVGANLAARLFTATSLLLSALLFAPAEFARFGALLAALTFASAIQFLRYDSIIVSATSAAGQRAALRLSGAVGLAVWASVACVAWRAAEIGVVGRDFAALFVVALGLRGLCRYISRIAIRHGDFAAVGNASLLVAATQPLVIVLAWLGGASGVVAMGLCDIIGNFCAAAYLGWRFRGQLRDALRVRPHDPSLLGLARDWVTLPTVNLPSTAMAAAFIALPPLAILHSVEAQLAGLIALAFRLLDAPVQVLTGAVAPIAMNRHVAQGLNGLPKQDVALISWLTLAVLALFGGACLTALLAEPWLARTHWAGLGLVLPFVALVQAGNAFALPLIEVADLRRDQRHLLAIQAAALIGMVLVAVLAPDWRLALLGFGLIALARAGSLAAPFVSGSAARATV